MTKAKYSSTQKDIDEYLKEINITTKKQNYKGEKRYGDNRECNRSLASGHCIRR